MHRKGMVTLSMVVCIFILGFVIRSNIGREEACQTRKSMEATALAFGQTMEMLEEVINEGAIELKDLYDTDKKAAILETIDKENYFISEQGVFLNGFDSEGSTGFATGYVPFTDDLIETLMATESLNEYFKELKEMYPFVTQIYYNEIRSFSRVYPAFQTAGMIKPQNDLANYNFFNLAFFNGEESVFINKPYIDPAGQGWVISMIHPVIVEGRLKGVFGVDLSVERLNEMLIVTSGMMVLNEQGDVITLSEDMYQQVGLKVLKKHPYYSDVNNTISQPIDYNLNFSKIEGFREMWRKISIENELHGNIDFDCKVRTYCAFEVDEYGIYILHINTH